MSETIFKAHVKVRVGDRQQTEVVIEVGAATLDQLYEQIDQVIKRTEERYPRKPTQVTKTTGQRPRSSSRRPL